MIVYIAERYEDWEGSGILGIFETENSAENIIAKDIEKHLKFHPYDDVKYEGKWDWRRTSGGWRIYSMEVLP